MFRSIMNPLLKKFFIPVFSLLLLLPGISAASDEQPDKWDQAGQKVREATQAVGEATEESTDKAVAEALKAWEKAKLKYKQSIEAAKKKYEEEVEKARAKIHAATAPKNDDQKTVDENGVE